MWINHLLNQRDSVAYPQITKIPLFSYTENPVCAMV
nr:MAG TPA: hypothetical protein [Caudoviricetes sp.]